MKFLLDFLPVALFFAIFKWANNNKEQATTFLHDHFLWLIHGTLTQEVAPTLLATIAVIVASLLQVLIMKFMRKEIGVALWIGVAIITIMGTITLWFSSPIFVKLKPTILYGLFALIIAIGQFRNQNIIKMMLGKQLELPSNIWVKAAWQWCLFFIGLGIANTWIALNMSEEAWVNFKFWGLTSLLFIFSIAQVMWFSKYLPKEMLEGKIAANDSENK